MHAHISRGGAGEGDGEGEAEGGGEGEGGGGGEKGEGGSAHSALNTTHVVPEATHFALSAVDPPHEVPEHESRAKQVDPPGVFI